MSGRKTTPKMSSGSKSSISPPRKSSTQSYKPPSKTGVHIFNEIAKRGGLRAEDIPKTVNEIVKKEDFADPYYSAPEEREEDPVF